MPTGAGQGNVARSLSSNPKAALVKELTLSLKGSVSTGLPRTVGAVPEAENLSA